MSPAAITGPPNGHASFAGGNGYNDHFPLGNGDVSSTANTSKTTKRVYQHIDDLVAVRPDVDTNKPMRTLLRDGETLAKEAETYLDFRRADLALQNYIKSYIIAVEIVPRHKDYPDLQAGRGDLHRQYSGLRKRLMSQNERFEKVKVAIKENNEASGVLPSGARRSMNGANISASLVETDTHSKRPESRQNNTEFYDSRVSIDKSNHSNNSGHAQSLQMRSHDDAHSSLSLSSFQGSESDEATSRKRPPVVHPKPQTLQGKAVKATTKPSDQTTVSGGNGDLLARFARLKSSESVPTQDPRIKTRPLPTNIDPFSTNGLLHNTSRSSSPTPSGRSQLRNDRPIGPRPLPNVPTGPPQAKKLPLIVDLPQMPRAPDAIYSPARTLDSSGHIDQPQSNPTGPFTPGFRSEGMSRNNSGSWDYMSATSNFNDLKSQSSRNTPRLPDTTIVTAEELVQYLNRGSIDLRVLLVDIRNREDFDSGHIMAPSIICIEPLVLRGQLSAEEVAERLVLSPESEIEMFRKRDEFDLVVFYDQQSVTEKSTSSSRDTTDSPLAVFSRAVYDWGYDKQLKRKPMLLSGGVESWIDLMGQGSLKASRTAPLTSGRKINPSARHSRAASTQKASATRRLSSVQSEEYMSRPLSAEEEKKWAEMAVDDELPALPIASEERAAVEASFIRNTEDFFKRFPEASAIQESMVAPSTAHQSTPMSNGASVVRSNFDVNTEAINDLPLPKIPTRPPPAVPRPSYRGSFQKNPGPSPLASQHIHESPNDSISAPSIPYGRTGLSNLGNSCYMNSTLQCLSGTVPLRIFLVNSDLSKLKPLPRTKSENSDPPRLMVKNLANLLRHLWAGNFTYVTPRTLVNYIARVHGHNRAREDTFGTGRQHDASEFLTWILEILGDELNYRRNAGAPRELSEAEEQRQQGCSAFAASHTHWRRGLAVDDSSIAGQFGGLSTTTRECPRCNFATKSWVPWVVFQLEIVGSPPPPLSSSSSSAADPDSSLSSTTTTTTTTTLKQLLDRHHLRASSIDARCFGCKVSVTNRATEAISRFPDFLIINLGRIQRTGYTSSKITTDVSFPLDGLDLTPYALQPDEADKQTYGGGGGGGGKLEREFVGPFIYDCYAIIKHRGTVTSGHWWALRREANDAWFEYNDSNVSPAPLSDTQGPEATILWYRRRRA